MVGYGDRGNGGGSSELGFCGGGGGAGGDGGRGGGFKQSQVAGPTRESEGPVSPKCGSRRQAAAKQLGVRLDFFFFDTEKSNQLASSFEQRTIRWRELGCFLFLGQGNWAIGPLSAG